MSRQTKTFSFCDFPNPGRGHIGLTQMRCRDWLHTCAGLEECSRNPDFVIHSVFGRDHLNYPNAVRILFTGENVHPDFNLCDYAFGFDWMKLGDRHVRAPNYLLYEHFEQLRQDVRTNVCPEDFRKRRFCNFIYTNGNAHPFRDRVFHALHDYRAVDSVGAHLRNSDAVIGAAYQGDWWSPKVDFQRGYRFSIAFENSSTPGYTTEKIVHALAAGTIPIYWGNPEVGREFNEARFINCHKLGSVEAIVERVREINENETLQQEILSEPFFPGGDPDSATTPEAVASALVQILSQPIEEARRRNRYVWGLKYEEQRRRETEALKLLESRKLFWRVTRKISGWNRRI